MSRFDLIFTGELVAGCDPAQVRRDLERLFKTDAAAVARLFTGKPVVIKKAIDEQTAQRYRAALQQAGALCRIRPVPVEAAAEVTAPVSASDQAATSLANAAILPPGTPFPEVRKVVPPIFDFADLSVAPPGETLVDAPPAASVAPPAPGAYEVAPPGEDLITPRPVTPAPIPDISALTLAPPRTEVLTSEERNKPSPPPPDPGDLTLAD